MRIKIDENLPLSLAVTLRTRGHDTDTVVDEGLSGTTDPDLLAHATREGRMIFTLDRGFGDIRRYPPGSHPGIVIFRLDNEAPAVARRCAVRCPGPQPTSSTAPGRIDRCRTISERSSACTLAVLANSSMYCFATTPYAFRTSSTDEDRRGISDDERGSRDTTSTPNSCGSRLFLRRRAR